MSENCKLILKKGKDASVRRFHPWIFSGAVSRTEGDPQPGDTIAVHAANGDLLGTGFYEGGSIAVRILSFKGEAIGRELFIKKLSEAWKLRSSLRLTGSDKTNAFRLVHGDGDGIPGLIVDWYKGTAVIQAHSYGIYRNAELIADSLKEVIGEGLKQVYDKSAGTLGGRKLGEIENRYLYTEGEPFPAADIQENGHTFRVNWEEGQKTGFFLDQRDNRALLGSLAEGKKVLNAFSYSGGFSIYALKSGAEKVLSVDSSAHAMDMLEENLKLNSGAERHESARSEVYPVLRDRGSEFDLIILDPPAFAKHKSARHQAVQGYKRLNQAAFGVIPAGGLVLTFSCSQVVGQELFEGAVRAAAIEAGRSIRVLGRLTQPADHPINIFQPEGEYLKGLLLQIR